jgi:hypothetical protein
MQHVNDKVDEASEAWSGPEQFASRLIILTTEGHYHGKNLEIKEGCVP